ncbi:hypothetical protein Tco_0091929 [Tanacetum coccineum]
MILSSLFAIMRLNAFKKQQLCSILGVGFLQALRTQFKGFLASKGVNATDLLNQGWQQDFEDFTRCEPSAYRRDLLENLDTLEAVIHRAVITYGRLQLQSQDAQINPVQAVDDSLNVSKSSWIESENHNALSKSMNETQLQQHESLVTESTTLEANLNTDVKALDDGSVITESSETKSDMHDTSSSSRTYITHVVDANIRPVNDQVPSAEVHLTAHIMSLLMNKSILINLNQVTPHYLPKVREYVLAKPHHVIAPGSSRNSQEEPYGSNDMAHNHYLEEAKKKTQKRNRNSKPSVMHTTSLPNTTNGSKPNPRSNNQILLVSKSSCGMSNGVSLVDNSRNSSSFSDSKHFVCSTCHKCIFNANHDNFITKFLKEVNSLAKVQSPKTRNNNKLVEPKSHTQKPSRQIAIGQRFSLNKSSAVHEKPNTPRSCLRWIPTGRIFKLVGLRWIPTGKMFIDSITKVDSEPPNGSNEDITNPYECDQTLNVSACTLNLSAGLVPQPPSPTPNVPPIKNDWDSLLCPMIDEYFNPLLSVVQPILVAVVQEPIVSTDIASSTRIDQDRPSISTSETT